jgi:hypothetical protein
MADVAWRRFAWGRLTVNGEALTLADGELTAGAWGEGFVDRRHPHTVLHEAMVGIRGSVTCGRFRCGGDLYAGKGFVPFGSDDPMTRPFVAYPVNHHLAQILERAMLGARVGVGPIALEAALFNGDEPERVWQWPRLARFGDSWSVRLGVEPLRGLELEASRAHVASPEARLGTGPDQTKWHASARVARTLRSVPVYALAEWGRTTEVEGVFHYASWLLELAIHPGAHGIGYRLERTDRPEEERLTPFRSVRPHHDNSILGITQWTLHTVRYGVRVPAGRAIVEPFLEATVGTVREIAGGLFDVRATYGSPDVRRVSVGASISLGMDGHRMGRYGKEPAPHHQP